MQNNQNNIIFFSSLERIGKLIEFKIEKGQHEKAKEYFEYLLKAYNRFFKLSYENPSYIESLTQFDNRFKNFSFDNTPLVFIKVDETAKSEKNEFEVIQENISNAISVLCNILYKIWKASHNNDDLLFSRKILNAINGEISKLSLTIIEPSYIQELLNTNYNILKQGIKTTDADKRMFLTKTAYEWYLHSVFQKKFNIGKYLLQFDQGLFSTFRFILKQDQQSLFNDFIESVIHGSYDPSYDSFYFGYKEFEKAGIKSISDENLKAIEDEGDLLSSDSFHKMYILKNLKDWQTKKEDYKAKIELLITQKEKPLLDELLLKMNNQAEKTFKYRNLQFNVICIGVFATFHKRYNYLRFMLNFNQPDDSSASWNNKDITPTTLYEVTKFLSYKDYIESSVRFLWENHHGFEIYFYEYFLILYLNAMKLAMRKGKNPMEEVGSVNIEENGALLEYTLEELINHISLLKTNPFISETLKFKPDLINTALQQVLEALLKKVKDLKNKKENDEKISPAKVEAFKKNVIAGFHKSGVIRNIYTRLNKFKNKIADNTSPEGLMLTGVNQVYPKGSFTSRSDDWGNSFGVEIANTEDFNLLYKIVPKCKHEKIKDERVIEILENEKNLTDKIIICLNYRLSYKLFRNSEDYVPSWEAQPPIDKAGYDGKYKNELEVYHIYSPYASNQVIIIDKNKMGELIQYSPVTADTQEFLRDIFFFNVEAFNDNEALIQPYINDKAIWLTEKGDVKAQRDYLLKSVWLRIFEKVNLELKNDEIIGTNYIIEE